MADLVAIDELRPTQMTVGMREVERRAHEIQSLSPKGRDAYVASRLVPCVRGLRERLYIIDRHHMCRALQSIGVAKVHVDVHCVLPKMEKDEFWTFMDLRGWVHPFDSEGRRREVSKLPTEIGQLQDDPYRALAGFLRRDHGFLKEDSPFEEFIWADFLRRRVDNKLLGKDFDKAKAAALALARSQEASHLPGWTKSK